MTELFRILVDYFSALSLHHKQHLKVTTLSDLPLGYIQFHVQDSPCKYTVCAPHLTTDFSPLAFNVHWVSITVYTMRAKPLKSLRSCQQNIHSHAMAIHWIVHLKIGNIRARKSPTLVFREEFGCIKQLSHQDKSGTFVYWLSIIFVLFGMVDWQSYSSCHKTWGC